MQMLKPVASQSWLDTTGVVASRQSERVEHWQKAKPRGARIVFEPCWDQMAANSIVPQELLRLNSRPMCAMSAAAAAGGVGTQVTLPHPVASDGRTVRMETMRDGWTKVGRQRDGPRELRRTRWDRCVGSERLGACVDATDEVAVAVAGTWTLSLHGRRWTTQSGQDTMQTWPHVPTGMLGWTDAQQDGWMGCWSWTRGSTLV
jgi:hypothetical protein